MADEEVEVQAAVVKRGETCVIATLSRTAQGLSCRVKAIPDVELFMRGLAPPETPPVEVSLTDRYWVPVKRGQPLLAYRLGAPLTAPINPMTGSPVWTLDRLARPILEDVDSEGRQRLDMPINISFLRLIGISEGAGVTFNIRGVYSIDQLRVLQDKLSEALQQFYVSYIRPVNMSVIVSTQELQM